MRDGPSDPLAPSALRGAAVAIGLVLLAALVAATWLCASNHEPRLVGRAPIGGLLFTASGARVSDDLRRIDLDDARLVLGGRDGSQAVKVHASAMSIRGLAPWARASAIAPA